jgi:peptide maturation system acyl carrier-related protein
MNKNMDRLLKIFKERFNMDLYERWADLQDENLLGSKLGMRPGDLIYLFFDIEKEFGITIPQEHIISGKFTSLRNIVQMIHCEQGENDVSITGAKASR